MRNSTSFESSWNKSKIIVIHVLVEKNNSDLCIIIKLRQNGMKWTLEEKKSTTSTQNWINYSQPVTQSIVNTMTI